MAKKRPNIFISWSGPRSKHVAKALNDWLPTVLQSARPWFSTLSIDKGARPLEEIAKALDSIEVGVSCLTPENLMAPWILYEGGALSKRIGQKSRLCTYLLDGLKPEEVPPPLGMFQGTRAERDDTWQMLHSINTAVSPDPVPEPALKKLFERMWPDLEKDIKSMPTAEEKAPPRRSVEDMFTEILGILRSETMVIGQLDRLNAALTAQWELQMDPAAGSSEFLREARNRYRDLYQRALFSQYAADKRPPCVNCGSTNVAAGPEGKIICLACGLAYAPDTESKPSRPRVKRGR
jgi:hypothetical protein